MFRATNADGISKSKRKAGGPAIHGSRLPQLAFPMKRFILLALCLFSFSSVRAADFATTVMDATYKFFDPDSSSTCFFVARDAPDKALYLVTAAHTFQRTKKENGIVVLREVKPDASYERHDHQVRIRSGEKPLWIKHPSQDVAVLKLTEPLPFPVVPLSVSLLADREKLKASKVHICSPLFILTYPQRFESNPASFPVGRQGVFASPPLLPASAQPVFLADFTTFAGDSGGPVFIDSGNGKPLVVGIVFNQHYHDEKLTTEYEETLIHHPLNVGGVLHSEFVLETIETAAKEK